MNRIIARDIKYPPPAQIAQPNTPLYDMIRFWGRKPHNIVSKYIEHYTDEGEIVLDPFAGCGVSVIEAARLGRKGIYNDLNKLCHFIARTSFEKLDIEELNECFDLLMERIKYKKHEVLTEKGAKKKISIDELYHTKCKNCGNNAEIIETEFVRKYKLVRQQAHSGGILEEIKRRILRNLENVENMDHVKLVEMVESELNIRRREELTRAINELLDSGEIVGIGEIPIRIKYSCTHCNRTEEKKPDTQDQAKIREIEKLYPAYYYPNFELKYPNNERFYTYRPGTESVDKLFTKRNLIALSILRHEIDNLGAKNEIKRTLLLCFAAILEHVSKMQRPNKKGWDAKNYVIRPNFLEWNVFHVFRNRFRKIVEGKKEANSLRGEALFLFNDARRLPLKDNSVDYVFTDPEYGESIQYYELSYMASCWLGLNNDWKNEIVVNPKQGKDTHKYRQMLLEAFSEIYRVLKPGKYMTVTFHNRELKYWNALMYAILNAGFEYVDAIYQLPQKEYTNWLYAMNPGEMRGDVYITFRKPMHRHEHKEENFVGIRRIIGEVIVPEGRKIILLHQGNATYEQLVRGITLKLLKKELLHSEEIESLNYERIFDDYFERVRGRGKVWTLKRRDRRKLSEIDFIPLDRRIYWLIYATFEKKGNIVSLDDILSNVFTSLKNAKTPEHKEILEVLGEIAEPKRVNGQPYWRLKQYYIPDVTEKPTIPEPVRERIRLEDLDHDRIIVELAKLGKDFGFEIWIGEQERRRNRALERHATMNTLKIEANEIVYDRLKNVDVIWWRPNCVFLIEVENTTNPRMGILRMANIMETKELRAELITVIPDSKLNTLKRCYEEPAVRKLLRGQIVRYLTYSTLMSNIDYINELDDFISLCDKVT